MNVWSAPATTGFRVVMSLTHARKHQIPAACRQGPGKSIAAVYKAICSNTPPPFYGWLLRAAKVARDMCNALRFGLVILDAPVHAGTLSS